MIDHFLWNWRVYALKDFEYNVVKFCHITIDIELHSLSLGVLQSSSEGEKKLTDQTFFACNDSFIFIVYQETSQNSVRGLPYSLKTVFCTDTNHRIILYIEVFGFPASIKLATTNFAKLSLILASSLYNDINIC